MYSFPDLEPVCCSVSSSSCYLLTCKQILQEAGQVVWYSSSLSEFSTVGCDPHNQRLWNSQWSRNRCFYGLSWFLNYPMDVGNLISGSSAFSKSSLNICKFTVQVLLKPSLEILVDHSNFLSDFKMSSLTNKLISSCLYIRELSILRILTFLFNLEN